MQQKFNEESIIDFQVLEIGKKMLNIARYNNKKDLGKINKWLAPEFTLMKKELYSVVESMPEEAIFKYSRQINNK